MPCKSVPVVLPAEEFPIERRIDQLLERLSETEACGFEDLFEDVATRGDMIVTFLAMLEMIRLKLIRVFQSGGLGAIRIYKRARPADAPHPIHDPEDEYKAHHPPGDSPLSATATADGKELPPQTADDAKEEETKE
jgi:segregation and condensation protein A